MMLVMPGGSMLFRIGEDPRPPFVVRNSFGDEAYKAERGINNADFFPGEDKHRICYGSSGFPTNGLSDSLRYRINPPVKYKASAIPKADEFGLGATLA